MGAIREKICLYLIASMLIITPIMGSGKMVNTLLTLELLGLILIVIGLPHKKGFGTRFNKMTYLFLSIIFLMPILYLIPLPLSLWEVLPNRSFFIESVNWVSEQTGKDPWLAVSLIPYKSVHAFLALIPLIAVFLVTAKLSSKSIIQLIFILIAVAAIQAFLGLIQYANRDADWAFFGFGNSFRSAKGTYLNRDHYAALLFMTLPLVLGMLLYYIGQKIVLTRRNKHTHRAITKILVFFCAFILLILGGILSNSRAGVFLAIFGAILSFIIFARHIGGDKQSLGITITLAIVGSGLAGSIGMIPIINRFISANPMDDLRWKFFRDIIPTIGEYLPFGSGPGTFQEVYKTIQPIDRLQFINHAHNDYLELLLETGLIGLALILIGIILYIKGWLQMKGEPWKQIRFIRAASGIAILLLSLHLFVDSQLHTPANALVFVFLSSIFLMKPYITEEAIIKRRQRRHRRKH